MASSAAAMRGFVAGGIDIVVRCAASRIAAAIPMSDTCRMSHVGSRMHRQAQKGDDQHHDDDEPAVHN